jgi:HEAT repeat protein/TolA-binding protein
MTRALVNAIISLAALPMLAVAQDPPRPATPPRAPTPRAVPVPRAMPAPKIDFEYEFHLLEPEISEMARHAAEQARLHAEDFRLQAEDFRFQADEFRELAKASVKLDVEAIKEQAWHSAELAKAAVADMKFNFDFEPMHIGPMFIEPMHIEPMVVEPFKWEGFAQEDRFARSRPREPWAQEDPADSLYRVAREALNRGEYRRASQVFNEVTRKFPQSRYAQDCAYWEAFSRYRIGTTDELRLALRILDGKGDLPLNVEQIRGGARGNGNGSIDIPSLRTRVLGALAARGDRDAEGRLKAEAAQQGGERCDREEVSVRAEALNALAQMDIAAAMPTVKKVLAQRDECTVELRRRALYIVGRQPGPDATAIILDVAKNDTDRNIRGEAMRWLPRVAGDAAIPQLEEMLRTSPDEQTQRAAVSALGAIDSDASRRAIRAIIERNDAAERVRREAILGLAREKEGRQVSTDELNYLRALYSRMPTTGLKESVLSAVSRVPAAENEQFLLGIARNVNEPPQLRAAALQRLGRMETVKVEDIAKLYDVADSRGIREQILSALAQRSEPQAIDKMMEIARRDTDPRIRSYAISLLGRSNNERAKQLLKDLIEKP